MKTFQLKIEENKDISHFFTLKTKVIARYFFEAKTREDLINIKKYSLEKKIPIFILGGGSNIAVLSGKLDYLVVKNNYLKLEIIDENEKEAKVLISSGYPVSLLIAKSIDKGLGGFEYHQGLPGTVGGAIYMNSKWTKPLTYFGDNLIEAFLVDKSSSLKKVNRDYFNFAYDYSILQKTKEIFVEGVFLLKKDKKEEIKKRANFALSYRKTTQPYGVATCGCFFQNPGGVSAGYLIDKSGLKGFKVGGFYVSQIHANFIVNDGSGKKEDLLKLLEIIKNKVKEKFNIQLEEEVVIM
ncbi:MAG: UDP-N-acetylmuramate dehydrogenase [Patescibacteria group bacterium]|nr:UDP-N-acetylmuramate dehydrogenase [Patescibacteria group bacterium]